MTNEQPIIDGDTGKAMRTTKPFQNEKIMRIPGMQIMPFAQVIVPRPSHQVQEHKAGSSAPDGMSPEECERKFAADCWRAIELETINNLTAMHKYDPRIDVEDAQILCNAIRAIDRALGTVN